jgi:aspartate/methionine/tyrosine aminotransferase
VQPVPPQAGWYLPLRLPPGVDDEALALTLLREHGVYVHPGYMFRFDEGTHLVVSLLTPEPDFETGLRRVAALVAFQA